MPFDKDFTVEVVGNLGSISTIGTMPAISIGNATGGTLDEIGSISTIGTMPAIQMGDLSGGTVDQITTGSIVVTAGTVTVGSIAAIGQLHNAGTIQSGTLLNSGTTTGVGVVSALTSGTVAVNSPGTITSGSIAVTTGTISDQAITSFATIVATVSATAGTTAQGTITGLGGIRSMNAFFDIKGVGGTAVTNHYIQVSPDAGATWYDYARTAQVGSGGGTRVAFTASPYNPSFATTIAVGTGLLPILAVNTVMGGAFGDRVRLVSTVNAGGTNAGTTTLKLSLTT